MLALQTGTSTLRLDGVTPVDIAEELTRQPSSQLTNDEHALVHLYSARIQRNIGATAAARKAIEAARALGPSTRLQAQLSLEMREVLFQDGDAKAIEAELRRLPDEGSDVYATCRRGADWLLLRQRDDANDCYTVALDRAANGDEKYAALRGKLASTREPLTFSDDARAREAELWDRLRAIREEERPETQRALALIEDAGDSLLDGKHVESAVEKLHRFLEEARRLGWPHSPDHNVSDQIESAARRAARLLLLDDSLKTNGTEPIKEGLALLCRYGLASKMRELFTRRHRDALARSEADVTWFREFSAIRPTLPRAADARFTAALLGIPLLDDETIEAVVGTLADRTDACFAGDTSDPAEPLIVDWWGVAMEMSEHLPEGAAKRMLGVVMRYLLDPRASFEIPPQNLVFELWIRQGALLKGGAESHELTRAGVDALRKAMATSDPWWVRGIAGCIRSAAASSLFNAADVALLGNAAQTALNAELAKLQLDDDRVLQLVSLIGELGESEIGARLATFAAHVNTIVQTNLRSSSLGFALHCARLVLARMAPAQQQQLLQTVIGQCERVLAGKDEWEGVGSLASTLASLATELPRSRRIALDLLTRLAQHDIRALAALGRFQRLSKEEARSTARIAEAALFTAAGERSKTIWQIAHWLETRAARSTADGTLDLLLGACVSDSPDTRSAAIAAVSAYFRAHRSASPALCERCFRVVKEVARHDPSWRVRARAMNVLPVFARKKSERQSILELVDAASKSLVAIERRVADAVRRDLASPR
jgi:hypothetical protein